MKKFAMLLALLLALAGCDTVSVNGPVGAGSSAEAPSASESADASLESNDPAGLPKTSASAAVEAPMPDAPPSTTVGAIELPKTLYTTSGDYSLELLTPAQYDMYLPLNRGGPRGYLTCDYFAPAQGGKYAIANPNGKIVTDFVFTSDDSGWYTAFGDALASVQKDGKYGVVNTLDGTVVIPFEYDSTWPLYGGKLIECTTGDDTELKDLSGKTVFTAERGDEVLALSETLAILQNDMIKFYSLKDFSPIQNFGCDEAKIGIRSEISAQEDRVVFTVDGRYGMADGSGNIIVEPSYDEIGYFNKSNEFTDFSQDGKKGIMDIFGKITCKAQWEDLVMGETSASVCKDGRWGVITGLDNGKVGIEPFYDYVTPFSGEYACFERNGRYGLIDREGNEIMNSKYEGLLTGDAAHLDKGYVLFDGDNGPGSYGIMTTGGKVILSSSNYITRGEDQQYMLVMTPQEKWGYIDRTGKFVIDAKFDYADNFMPDKDLAFVERDGKIGLIDRKGNIVLETVFSDLIGYNPETMVCAMEYTNDKGEVKSCLVKLNL